MRALPTLSADDRPGFQSNMPVSKLIERNTRAVEASVISLAPPIVETEDGVMYETRPTPIEPHRAQGLEPSDPRSRDRGSKAGSRRARGRLASNKSQGENADEPQWPLPIPQSRQGHLDLLVGSKPPAEPIESPSRGDLLEGGLRSNRMPHEGFADPITSNETGFRLNMPVSLPTERITRAIEASDVNSTPPVAETTDRAIVTKMSRPSTESPLCARARGRLDLRGDQTHGSRTIAKILGRGYVRI